MKPLFSEIAALLAFASGLGLAVNAVSPAGIAVTRALPITDLDDRYITAEEAKARFEGGRSVFVDARTREEFAAGHVEGAVSLPLEGFEARYAEVAKLLPREAELVVYCRGAGCSESRQVADQLQRLGYERSRIRIFRDGYTAWKQRGWPAEK